MYHLLPMIFRGIFDWKGYVEQLREDSGLYDSKNRKIVPWTDEVNKLIFENNGTKH